MSVPLFVLLIARRVGVEKLIGLLNLCLACLLCCFFVDLVGLEILVGLEVSLCEICPCDYLVLKFVSAIVEAISGRCAEMVPVHFYASRREEMSSILSHRRLGILELSIGFVMALSRYHSFVAYMSSHRYHLTNRLMTPVERDYSYNSASLGLGKLSLPQMLEVIPVDIFWYTTEDSSTDKIAAI